jgi:hypothetical protein
MGTEYETAETVATAEEHPPGDLGVRRGRSFTTIDLPAPTAWPVVVAFGLTLVFAGFVTNVALSLVGLVSGSIGLVGWFRDVFPHEAHVAARVFDEPPVAFTRRRGVARVHVSRGLQRAWLPLEIYPISAGVKGGLAGSVAMAAIAMLYGVISGTSIWYPINLLAAGFLPNAMHLTTSELAAFHFRTLLAATAIHLITSLLVGLLYGAMLPVLARRPILLGGVLAPIFWSGLLHGILNIVSPLLHRRIDWFWFVLSQMAFGVVAGFVVSRQERVPTWQGAPLAIRMGVEAPGIIAARDSEERP